MKRIGSIDLMRGLVMILMTLDHVRDLMHVTSVTQSPTDLATASPALFLTRWITHLCAPTFVFLSGTSAYMSMKREGSGTGNRNFLLWRGLWLIVLDFTIVNFGVWFDPHLDVFLFDVLSAIGFGFIVLRLMGSCSIKAIAITGLALIFLHPIPSLLSPASGLSLAGRAGLLFFRPDAIPLYPGKILIMGYPPLPWLGILLTGFAAGSLFALSIERRNRIFFKMGLAAIAAFVLLRWVNVYGDSQPWAIQKSGLYTVLSFINVTKYPPSPDFCLLFLGCMFLLLSLMQGAKNRLWDRISTYGKVPLAYFLVHWYLIHPLVFLMVWLQGFKVSDMEFGTHFGRPGAPNGLPLWAVYLVWIGAVLALYPACRWYGAYKQAHREKKWLRYL